MSAIIYWKMRCFAARIEIFFQLLLLCVGLVSNFHCSSLCWSIFFSSSCVVSRKFPSSTLLCEDRRNAFLSSQSRVSRKCFLCSVGVWTVETQIYQKIFFFLRYWNICFVLELRVKYFDRKATTWWRMKIRDFETCSNKNCSFSSAIISFQLWFDEIFLVKTDTLWEWKLSVKKTLVRL